MPSVRQFSAIADIAKLTVEAAPGAVKLAEALLGKPGAFSVLSEEASSVGLAKAVKDTDLTEGARLVDRMLMQTMSRKGPITANMGSQEITSPERFSTRVVSVSANSWLGETSALASRHLGRFKSVGGADFGSASVLEDGYVLTANHCVEATNRLPLQARFPAGELSPVRSKTMRMSKIELHDGRQFSTELVAYNPDKDIALLKIHGETNLPGLDLADTLPAGKQRAAAFGYPLSRTFEQYSASPGTFLPGVDRSMPNHSRFALRTFGGYSGGPILADGKVAGIVSHGNISQEMGITYSPKLDDIRELLALTKAQAPGSGVIRVSRDQVNGELVISHEPAYDWWNQSELALHDTGKGINTKIFAIPDVVAPQFKKGPLTLGKA